MNSNKRFFTITISKIFLKYCLFIIFQFSLVNANGQWRVFNERNEITFHRYSDYLSILNNFDTPLPKEKQELYKLADSILKSSPYNDFVYLSGVTEFQELCKKHGILHLGGPMLGNITESSADIWIRTVKPDFIRVVVFEKNVNNEIIEKEISFGPVKSTVFSQLSAIVHISGLKPNTRYQYKVFVGGEEKKIEIDRKELPKEYQGGAIPGPHQRVFKGGQEIKIPDNAYIQTLPASKFGDPSEKNIRIAFSSCFHRWGLGNEKQSKTIIDREPHAFIAHGDIAQQDKGDSIGRHSLDYLARDFFPAWQNLVSKVPVYTTWDDHDYLDDDLGGIPSGYTDQDRKNVREVFKYSWNNPSYGIGDEGVYFRTRIGPVDIIQTDNRYFREKGSMLGDVQMKWLEKQLLDCKGSFIILSSGTMWSDYLSNGKDSWGVYDPEGREKIFSLIEKNKISGVILISGDRHGARGFKIPRPSGFNFYEFQVSSAGGASGPPATKPEWTTQFFGLAEQGKYAFGEFTFDTNIPNPTVTFRLIGSDNGEIIYEKTLTRKQLTPIN